MKTTLEIAINTEEKPTLRKTSSGWEVVATVSGIGGTRGLWVRTWDPDKLQTPKDGKGFTITPTRRLKLR